MGTAAAMWTIAAITAATAGYSTQQSVHQGHKQQRMAEDQQRLAMKEQQEQKKQALAERKELIDQQRESLVQGYRTSTRNEAPKPSGLVGKLGDDTLG